MPLPNEGKIRDYYRIGKMLGSGKLPLIISNHIAGAFGEVRMCVHLDTGAQRAVKILKIAQMDEEEKQSLYNEIKILRKLVGSLIIFDQSFFL
jgi:serine/threonine protein kinase